MENKSSKIILIIGLLIVIAIGVIAGIYLNKWNDASIAKETNAPIMNEKIKLIQDIEYMEIAIEDEKSTELEYKDLIKIEDRDILENFANKVNTARSHEFNGAFGLDVLPYAILHLKNGDKLMIISIDDLEMEGEENGNYIIVTLNDDEENKKIYKVEEKIETEIIRLYNEAEKSIKNGRKK